MRINLITWCALAAVILLQGCASEPFVMPKKSAPQTGAIYGSFEVQGEELRNINILKVGRVYGGLGRQAIGEKVSVENNKFVAVNVEPGMYYVGGLDAGNSFFAIDKSKIIVFEVKPGQLKFIGSTLYEKTKDGGLFTFDHFRSKTVDTPTEMDMLRWMEQTSNGTGWERALQQRIRELGGKPRLAAERTGAAK